MTTAAFVSTMEIAADPEFAYLSPQCREHAVASSVLLWKAQGCLKHKDLPQTCVYGWGAAEEIARAVAFNWRDYGVEGESWQDLWALSNALSITSPDVIKAIEKWQPDYAALGAQKSWQALDERLSALGWNWDDFLANGFIAADNLRKSFEENRCREFSVKENLKRTARFIEQMQGWLKQPCPPEGFRQFHNR